MFCVHVKLRNPILALTFRFELKPYQLIGLKWLLLLHEHKLSGILADEMVRRPAKDQRGSMHTQYQRLSGVDYQLFEI